MSKSEEGTTLLDAIASANKELDDPKVRERISSLSEQVMTLLNNQENPRQAAHNIMGVLTRYLIKLEGIEVIARRFDLFAETLRILEDAGLHKLDEKYND